MRAFGIVIDPPVFDDFARLVDAHKPVLVQAFFEVSNVEAFDVGVLDGLAGVDEVQLDRIIIGPAVERAPSQSRAGS